MSFDNRTIFGPATPVGESGITVIRVSGKDCLEIVSKIFSRHKTPLKDTDLSSFETHTAHHGFLFDENNKLIDEIVLTIFKSPNSYTGEDVIEISSHGGIYIFNKISSLLIKQGIYHSEPGEFSKRAFLNGKLDLVQAEAIADLIRARTEQANNLALKMLSGEFSAKINELREELINYCSLLELELDFAEEGIDLVSRDELLQKVESLILRFENLTSSYESGKIIKEGINLAIVGKPNVGKSSIFNYLLKENRAIVSEVPGTTRDYLQEPLIMGGMQFNLIDTAGIRKTGDTIELEGVKRSKMKIEESDIVLEVEDLSNPKLKADEYVIGVPEEKIIKIFNKSDLIQAKSNGKLEVSALTGKKMQELQDTIVNKAKSLIIESETSGIIITNQRHRDILWKSCENLVNAKKLIINRDGNELISFEIRMSMECLSEIIGKTTNVDILNNIFSKFCIGK
ncbi:MAG TPA: tRNA uridine-5-carboxymethylaminomethyl(34) synthesis GTPase MnmE [Ignavibacteria bacterium]|jgi:tRNA modification GTPase